MGQLIVAIMNKVESMKTGATLDQETAELIEEVFGENFAVTDESIIDFSKLVYTDTFKSVMRQILERSMQEPNHPILKHVYHNLLDIEDLLMNYFIGFYIDKPASIKNYIYISWMLWVYLKRRKMIYIQHIVNECMSFPYILRFREIGRLLLLTTLHLHISLQKEMTILHYIFMVI